MGAHFVDQAGLWVGARVGGKQAILIGENHQHIGLYLVGNQCRQGIVVAKAQLIGGYGVVLVNDGHYPHLQQGLQGAASIQVTFAAAVVIMRQQYLCRLYTVLLKACFPGLHQPGLAYCRCCL